MEIWPRGALVGAVKGINPGLPCQGQDSTTELLLLNSSQIHEGPPKLWSAKTLRFAPLDIQTSLPKMLKNNTDAYSYSETGKPHFSIALQVIFHWIGVRIYI